MAYEILCGDALEKLKGLPAESVQCCVTSPPYWNLRDYGTAKWEGGDPDCDHAKPNNNAASTTMTGGTATLESRHFFKSACGICGAIRIDDQIGLESTPEAYIAKLIEIFREAKRALKDDGTLWVNIGDSYFGDSPTRNKSSEAFSASWDPSQTRSNGGKRRSAARIGDLKAKDLIGIPWMLAFALRADGWYLRQDIIWSKPACMPESVKDRCTKSHEYIFMFSKNRKYFYNADAIAEPAIFFESESKYDNGQNGMGGGVSYAGSGSSTRKFGKGLQGGAYFPPGQSPHQNARRSDKQRGHARRHDGFNDRWDALEKKEQCSGMRNKRSVWTIGPDPFPEAHFATFPEELPALCIMAGSKEGDLILDPFAGAGTTAIAALKLLRKAILIDLNPQYVEMAHRRIQRECGLLAAEI